MDKNQWEDAYCEMDNCQQTSQFPLKRSEYKVIDFSSGPPKEQLQIVCNKCVVEFDLAVEVK
jgi:hypothetical protein